MQDVWKKKKKKDQLKFYEFEYLIWILLSDFPSLICFYSFLVIIALKACVFGHYHDCFTQHLELTLGSHVSPENWFVSLTDNATKVVLNW